MYLGQCQIFMMGRFCQNENKRNKYFRNKHNKECNFHLKLPLPIYIANSGIIRVVNVESSEVYLRPISTIYVRAFFLKIVDTF